MELRESASAVSVDPSSSRLWVRLTYCVIESSEDSVASCQPCASWMFFLYWLFASSVWRRPMARAVLNGSSDGRLISLPEDALLCVLESFSESVLRSESTFLWTIEVVMRITGRPFRFG